MPGSAAPPSIKQRLQSRLNAWLQPVAFLGEVLLATVRAFKGWQFRKADLLRVLNEASAQALPIVMVVNACLLYTSPSPRDRQKSRMPSSA